MRINTSGNRIGETKTRHTVLLLMLLTSSVLCVAITDQSLWIDEAVMAYFASYDELPNMLMMVTNLRSSDPQMPLYIVYLWGWAKLFGTSEYALRAANVPFAVLLVTALGWTSWRVLGRPVLWVVFCFSPFIWFYMNEARPYIAIMACSAASTGALMMYLSDRERYGKIAPWICLAGLLIASGMQMLAAFLGPALVVLALVAMKQKRLAWNRFYRDWGPAFWTYLPLFLALGLYFGWTLSVGSGGARETPGPGNIAFALYEFVGFIGLGPPRHILREQPNLQVLFPYLPWIGVGAAAAGAVSLILVIQLIRRRDDYFQTLLVALLTGVSLFVITSSLADFRFWGRHLAVFFPLFSFMTIAAIGALIAARSWNLFGRITVGLLVCAWFISDARLWALAEYHKDDYRLAAKTALDLADKSNASIAWAANVIGGRYYGVGFEDPLEGVDWSSRGQAVSAASWSQSQVAEHLRAATKETPVVLVLSKPDLFDPAGIWAAAVDNLKPRKVAAPNTFNIYLFNGDGSKP